MIRVLIAEDSATVRELLVAVLGADPEIQVIGTAGNGLQAVRMTQELKPSLVTMDIRMPEMDGLEATQWIMRETPTPIVIVSGHVDVREVEVSMKALHAGALALLCKPCGPGSKDFETSCRDLVATVKAMAEVRVVRRWGALPDQDPPPTVLKPLAPEDAGRRLVAIAASTGGPAALHRILSSLPKSFAVPVLITQHVARGFANGLANWLDGSGPLQVKVAEHAEKLVPGCVYLAPDDRHLSLRTKDTIALSGAPPYRSIRPSANVMFEAVARVYGASAVGVVLSGMGDDGVIGLRAMREAGAWVIAQDEATSVVFGMPGAAIASGVARSTLPLDCIAAQLIGLVPSTPGINEGTTC